MPRLPTYPSWNVVALLISCSTVKFHCHELGTTARGFFAIFGDELPAPGGSGSVREGPLSVRCTVVLIEKGALPASLVKIFTCSRWKNCPAPARIAVFPFPNTSHAIPRRGAIRWLLFSMSARFGPGVPELKLVPNFAFASPQGSVPGTTTTPLQASLTGLVGS